MSKIKALFIIFSLYFLVSSLNAQTTKPTLETALQHFKAAEYDLALAQYLLLYDQYGKDPKFNHYYGACLVETNQQLAQASRSLKFASLKSTIKESVYYLARAYQLNYEFEEAIANYGKYLKIPNIPIDLKEKALRYTDESRIGASFTPKIYDITVLKGDTITLGEELNTIQISAELGKLMKNVDFFESGIDPNGVLFMTERGDRAFYATTGQNTERTDIYFIEKLIDGWGKPLNLGKDINSAADEKYPILLTDGTTLYFSSNRPGGMGGWDIYKATYNAESKTFSNVTNMGIPFNSPMDDYFFVPDEFSNKAWFATNRSSTKNKTVVTQIEWNGNIVKNNVTDITQVKTAAQLQLSENATASTTVNWQTATNGKQGKIGLFSFPVADTLEYTQYEHFRSEAALNEFKQGLELKQTKDSLMVLMNQKRARYASTNSEVERNTMVNDILRLEKQTYSLDAAIGQHYFNAQSLEQAKIKELVRNGQYSPLEGTKVEPPKVVAFSIADIPQDLTLYSADEFGKQLEKVQGIYPRLFSEDKIYQLKQADSLYAWGNLLNIESSRMLEKASKTTTTEMPLPKPFKADQQVQPTSEDLIKQAKDTKYKALTLYHQALDKKFDIYSGKYGEFKGDGNVSSGVTGQQDEAYSYKKESSELIEQAEMSGNVETYEKAGALKRKAVEAQEKGFFAYLEQLDNPTQVKAEEKAPTAVYALPAYSATQNSAATKPVEIVTNEPSPVKNTPVAEAAAIEESATNAIEYRIQIGVFRNQPNEAALKKLDQTTTEYLADSGLTKYYSGKYASYDQASSHLQSVKDAGFPGAFVVAFQSGKQISIQQARNIEAQK